MKRDNSRSQKIGWGIFTLGAIYMLCLGWFYSWWMVPAANQSGGDALSGWLGIFWSLSVPLGAFIVAIGAALIARANPRLIWFLILVVVLFTARGMSGASIPMIPELFGIGGGLITLFFIGSTLQWALTRSSLTGASKTGADLRMVGSIFFVVAAWNLCGIFGIGNFVLRPELAVKFAVPIESTIDAASTVMILLALGWGFTFSGQLVSRRSQAVQLESVNVPQTVAAD